jgi:predicted dehydrogenase
MDWQEGEPFNWPCASPSYFGLAAEGRGVLADRGSHALDLMCWWLGGTPEVNDYADDALGGTEAVADVKFECDGVPGHARFSWFNKLRNTFQVVGERAAVEGRIYDTTVVTMTKGDGRPETVRLPDPHAGDVGRAIIGNFVDVVDRGAAPLVPAAEVLPSIALIDECYNRRQRFDMPWLEPISPVMAHD